MWAAVRCVVVEVELAKVRAVSEVQWDHFGAVCRGCLVETDSPGVSVMPIPYGKKATGRVWVKGQPRSYHAVDIVELEGAALRRVGEVSG